MFIRFKQNIFYRRAYNTNFAYVVYIVFVDNSSGCNGVRVYFKEIGHIAIDVKGTGFFTSHYVAGTSVATGLQAWGKQTDFGNIIFNILNIAVSETKAPSPVKTFVCHRRLLRPHKKAVGSKVAKVIHHPVFQAIARTHHDHQHKDTPKHTERGKKGSNLIFFQRAENLLPVIDVKNA